MVMDVQVVSREAVGTMEVLRGTMIWTITKFLYGLNS